MAAALGCASAQALTIDLAPASQTAVAGHSFELALRVSGLGEKVAPSLSVFDLDVLFDPLAVSFESATFGDPALGDMLAPTVTSEAVLPSVGILNLLSLSDADPSALNDGQPGGFTLATLRFRAQSPGTTAFDLSINALGDADGAGLTPDAVNGASVQIVTSQAVPDGGPGLMAAVAFGALMIAHRATRSAGPRGFI